MQTSTLVAGSAAVLALIGASASAHHSFAMYYQRKVWTWEGTVVEFQWRQPHSHVIVDVPANAANLELAGRWDFEGSSPNIATRQGWNRNSFKPGDKITVVGNPQRNGSKAGSLSYAITADGKVLYHDINRRVTPENTPKPGAK